MSDWAALRRFTAARIGQRRAGTGVSTPELLAFQLAHAQARDAVLHAWDVEACRQELTALEIPNLLVHSCATDRTTYLRRPDYGRRLDSDSLTLLERQRGHGETETPDVALILCDGLSATAVHSHGVATIRSLIDAFRRRSLRCSPVVLVQNGRVALSDAIGHALGARAAVIVIGERPGLSAPDSLGIYLTYAPKPGNTDAERNCISNVRDPGGLPPPIAAERLTGLLVRALTQGISGVALKAIVSPDPPAELGEG